ncbi:MAG: glutamine--tRNA ligase/YqeY domain fusion protein [Gemmatimonadota bacterium]|jgi:glutaminyl-tRNA synthetase|nr:glutamine--tRNA ligase/YqeY domain fusion protein [Gemmatimonadota bacterium]MDP6802627.1 glutamine--tRNA ligase/YqeY domain fusion protein [Gemmatimonadota bacterium]
MTGQDSASDFIRSAITKDIENGLASDRVRTRFPPEPNGHLHIGHAKSICLNFGIAEEFGGRCVLRFDDTNPISEEEEFVESMVNDVRWLGFARDEDPLFASDYFEQMYELAVRLIREGHAYVDSRSMEEIRETRGTVTAPGTHSPHRDRPAEESEDLFARMRAGEFPDGAHLLRAKIDMAHPNMLLRDPPLYRIRNAPHHRTGDAWHVYPMYDWAHGLEDSIEGVTHSLCTLEFEVHRPLYDWFLEVLGVHHPRQIEFARLNLAYTVTSKRKLAELVSGGHVTGWDDPRMPTLSGLRRRGYTASSIRNFCGEIGVARRDSLVDMALLENSLREELNRTAPRVMAVLRPLKVVIENYPDDQVEMLDAENNPEDEAAGSREIPFSRELYVERTDFLEDAPRKWFRLAPGKEVRLKHAYFVTCREVVKDPNTGEVLELRCTYDPASRGGASPDGRKVRGTLHWVSAAQSVEAEVRIYDRLFREPDPTAGDADFTEHLNEDSLQTLSGCRLEPSLGEVEPGFTCQFMRHGYFRADPVDSRPGSPVFHRTAALRDSWAKLSASS